MMVRANVTNALFILESLFGMTAIAMHLKKRVKGKSQKGILAY